MAKEHGDIDRSESIEDLHHLRLMALLDDLVRDRGHRRAAADLGVDHRTLTASLESGQLSRRMRVALDQALLDGAGSPANQQRQRNDELAGRLEIVEGRVDELGQEMKEGLGAVQGDVRELRNEHGRALRGVEQRLSGVESGGAGRKTGESAAESGNAGGSGNRARPRREYPDLATLEPAEDDQDVFGDAWPLIREWRELKASHPDRGRGLEWLLVEERFLTVELELLEDHGLTLPPARFPLRGFDRNGQTGWRRKALEDTLQARRKRELLRIALRMFNPAGRRFLSRLNPARCRGSR